MGDTNIENTNELNPIVKIIKDGKQVTTNIPMSVAIETVAMETGSPNNPAFHLQRPMSHDEIVEQGKILKEKINQYPIAAVTAENDLEHEKALLIKTLGSAKTSDLSDKDIKKDKNLLDIVLKAEHVIEGDFQIPPPFKGKPGPANEKIRPL